MVPEEDSHFAINRLKLKYINKYFSNMPPVMPPTAPYWGPCACASEGGIRNRPFRSDRRPGADRHRRRGVPEDREGANWSEF